METKATFIDRIIQSRKISHFLFWFVFILATTLWASASSGLFKGNLINNLSLLPGQMMAAYLLTYYQAPKLLFKKKYFLFALSLFASSYVFAVIARLSIIYLAEPLIRKDFEQESLLEVLLEPLYLIWIYFPIILFVSFIMLSLKMIKDRFEEKHQLEVLQKEKATNELKFLKAQIHPHFLFNTLNNLYALTLAKSDDAPKVVVKLSELLDYILYQCNEPTIAIYKEVELIKGYIDLEMLRYGEQLDLKFNHQLEEKNTAIAPLILLSFIENAFKHGASGNPIDPKIYIDLKEEKEQLYFSVYNSKPDPELIRSKTQQRPGIGSGNIKRQLELNYPERHQLDIKETAEDFEIKLKIDLKPV